MPTRPDLFGFVVRHLDSCPACLSGPPCHQAVKLFDAAAQLGAQLLAPIPDIPRSPWKA